MSLLMNRRRFFHTATGALVMASSASVLKAAGADGEPIRIANILDPEYLQFETNKGCCNGSRRN